MALFGKKKRNEDDYLLDESEQGFIIHFDEGEKEEEEETFFKGAHKAPHAITIDEVKQSAATNAQEKPASEPFKIPMEGEYYSSAAKNLLNKMMSAKQAVEKAAAGESDAPLEEEAEANAPEIAQPETKEEPKAEAKTEAKPEPQEEPEADDKKVDEILAKAAKAAAIDRKNEPQFATPEFLEKLKGYLNDENEPAPKEEENHYPLESVEAILKSVEEKVKQKAVSERMNRDAEINYTPAAPEKAAEEPAPKKEEPQPQVTIFDEEQEPIKIDIVHIDPADDDLESTRPVPLTYQYSFADEALPNVDIESLAASEEEGEEPAEEKTIQFNSIKDISSKSEETAEEETEEEQEKDRPFRLAPQTIDGSFPEEDEEFEEEFDDYTCIEDAPRFKRELSKRCSSLMARIISTAVLTAFMALVSLPAFSAAGAANFAAFRVVGLILLAITLLVNLNTVLGLVSLFKGRPDLDTPIALSAVLAFIYSCCCVLHPEAIFLGAPIGLVFFAANLGKYLMEKRISKDFGRIANSESKLAIKLIDDTQGSADIAKGAGLENVLVCGTQRTANITDFFKKCYAPKPFEKMIFGILIAAGAIAIVCAAISFVLHSSVVSALGWLATILAVFCPPTYYLLNVIPFTSAAKNAEANGALICGLGGAENMSDANAVVFNADQLFPAGTVNLYQMKILSPNPIDQAIVEAAAVATAAKSPLADMFNRMAQGREDVVSDPVDAINLEGNMGISGWIKDRRILIGNRLLMETHGIPIPSVAVDRNILEKGFFPVYVACAGVPCALFVVGYNVDRRIKYELQKLCNTGAVVLVNSIDPNITEEMICDYFGIYRESVRMMNANSLNVYKNAVNYVESFPASGIYNGSAEGLASLLTASVKLKAATKSTLIINFVFIVLGALLCCYSIFSGSLGGLAAIAVVVLHLLNLLAGIIIPALYKA